MIGVAKSNRRVSTVFFWAALLVVAMLGCDGSATSGECAVVVAGELQFVGDDAKRLRASAPGMTRGQSVRLLYDVLRAEFAMSGSVAARDVRSMEDRLQLYRGFVQEHGSAAEALERLEAVEGVRQGPCFDREQELRQ